MSLKEMQRSKIVFFSHDAELYGASRSLVTLVKGLHERGVECLIIVPYEGPLIKYINAHHLKYNLVYYPSWFFKPKPETWKVKFTRAARFMLGLSEVLFNRKLTALLKDADLIITNTSAIPVGALLALKLKKKHIWHIRELVELDYGFDYFLGKRFFFYLINKTKWLLFNSVFVMNYYASHLANNKNVKTVIYNGVYSKEKFLNNRNRNKANKNTSEKTFIFCLIGFIHPGKGQTQAVDAMVEVTLEFEDVRLIIAGSGEVANLQKYIEEKKIGSKVSLTGYVQDVENIFLKSHCLLNCAKFEAFGRTTVEAMAHCLPVIGNNTAGTAEIIKHNYSGLLYNGTTAELVSSMKMLIKNPELARQLGYNAWQEAYEKYNTERYIDDYYRFIQNEALCSDVK